MSTASAVAALPVQDPEEPVQLPVTFPVKLPAILPVPVMVGDVRLLLVRVSVVSLPTSVVVDAGRVTVAFPEYAECAAACIAV